MITLYRIRTSPDAPTLRFAPSSEALDPEIAIFDGRKKGHLLPRAPFPVIEDGTAPPTSCCHLAAGVLVVDDDFLASHTDLNLSVVSGIEALALKSQSRYLCALNPMIVMPRSAHPNKPFDLRDWWPIFRIDGCDPTDIFCTSNHIEVPMNEFKYAYECSGLTGLIFEPVWAGKAD